MTAFRQRDQREPSRTSVTRWGRRAEHRFSREPNIDDLDPWNLNLFCEACDYAFKTIRKSVQTTTFRGFV